VRVGNGNVTSIGGVVGWTTVSDARYKKNITEGVHGLDFILQLNPVTYNLNLASIKKANGNENYLSELKSLTEEEINQILSSENAQEEIVYSGFLAQDVEAIAKKIGYNFSGIDSPKNENDSYGLRYGDFVVPLVKAVQEQQAIIEEMKIQNAKLNAENSFFRTEIEKIKAELGMDNKVTK
jgi:hypothetical protein